ncbi:MAG: tRNA guanosine(34) transglycosylase Tgt [Planctomycetota bacterium]
MLSAVLSFRVEKTCRKARLGEMTTPHGPVATPAFMPVGTAGSVKGVTPEQLRAAGVQMILGNTYHLMLRPGAARVARLGGLHRMMGWDGPILTDSGGYQVFSLAHRRTLTDDGVVFRSHIDGAQVELTPARAVEIQQELGADVIMQLDECPSAEASRQQVADAVARSADWAGKCKRAWLAGDTDAQALFGIQQGGRHRDLRAQSAEQLVKLDLPGYAVGGLSVGEGHDVMCDVLNDIDEQLPADRPRYLMGVGEPRDILAAVARGVDLFDCVLPTRNGRNAQAFTFSGRLRLRNARFADDTAPLEADCDCYTCSNFNRGTLRHLFMAEEMLGPTLVSIHNLRFFARLMGKVREAIARGDFQRRSDLWLETMYADDQTTESV